MSAPTDCAEGSTVAVPVLIVGAGPTGLVLALWLTRLGVRVRIIDKTAEPGTTSRALGSAGPHVGVLRPTRNCRRRRGRRRKDRGGQPVGARDRGVPGCRWRISAEGLTPFPFALVFPQDAHERLLIERLHALGVDVERRTELVGFERQAGGVRAVLRRPDGSEDTCRATYLAGCDGASSTVREGIGIGFPGGTYAGLFYVADVEASGPVTDNELHVDLDEADLLLVFPMKGKGCLRLVGNVSEERGRGGP